jgi:DNA-binding GntR family transcriptional regulator
MYDQHKRYRNIALTFQQQSKRNLHQEHKSIYEAALNRDVEFALKESEEHIMKTAKVDEELLSQVLQNQSLTN